MKNTTEKINDFSNRVLTIEQFCELTGYKKSYAKKLHRTGALPFSKPEGSRKIFIDKQAVEDWMLSNMKRRPKDDKKEARQIAAATYVTTHPLPL
jgi:excisionase family DNA binding protein